jgi:protein-S-isoprenylcysteine O-methyltransferase Ste14
MYQSNHEFLSKEVFKGKLSLKFWFYFLTIGLMAILVKFYLYFDGLFPYSPLVGQLIALWIALFGLGHFFIKKEKYQVIYKDNAYIKAFFRFHVTFIPFIYISAIHPIFILPYQNFFGNFFYFRLVLAAYFIISAVLLHYRTVRTFGVDNLFMYYVYNPEKSVMVQSVIHSILRHPVYSAMMRISLGLGILRGTLSSILTALILPIFNQMLWIYIFEEPDLIQRFGEKYRSYRKTVWALIVKPKNLIKFWMFLLGYSR